MTSVVTEKGKIMSKYIDITTINPRVYESSEVELGVLAYDYDEIQAMPFLDIVRCKDCKHSEPSEDNSLYCKHWDDHFGFFWDEVKSNDFCSYGDRKETDHE